MHLYIACLLQFRHEGPRVRLMECTYVLCCLLLCTEAMLEPRTGLLGPFS